MAGSRPRTLKPFEDFSILTSSIEDVFGSRVFVLDRARFEIIV